MIGCKTTDLVSNVQKDFAAEKKAVIFNKSASFKKITVPLNGMIFVNKGDTVYSIANSYKVIPYDIINDNNLTKPYNLKINQILFFLALRLLLVPSKHHQRP